MIIAGGEFANKKPNAWNGSGGSSGGGSGGSSGISVSIKQRIVPVLDDKSDAKAVSAWLVAKGFSEETVQAVANASVDGEMLRKLTTHDRFQLDPQLNRLPFRDKLSLVDAVAELNKSSPPPPELRMPEPALPIKTRSKCNLSVNF